MKFTAKTSIVLIFSSAALIGNGFFLYRSLVNDDSHANGSFLEIVGQPLDGGERDSKSQASKNLPDQQNSIYAEIINSFNEDNSAQFLNSYVASDHADYESLEFQRAIKKLSLSDWAAAQKYIDAIPSERVKNNTLIKVLPMVARQDPDLAISVARDTPNMTARNKILGAVCDSIATGNPKYVADLFIANGLKSVGNYEIRNLVADYARHDLEGARKFTESIEDPVIWKSAFTQYLYKWGEQEPYLAADYAISHKVSLHGALSVLGQSLAEKDIKSTLDYALSKPVTENSIEFLNGVYMRWSYDDVHSASDKILELPVERLRMSSYTQIAEKLAKVDPQKGTQWISKISSEKHKRKVTYRFVETWVSNDPNAAVKYVNSLPDGATKDSAIYPLVKRFQEVEPAYAMEWTQALNNEGKRDRWVGYVYSQWKKQDEQAAKAWLSESDVLPDASRQKLLEEVK